MSTDASYQPVTEKFSFIEQLNYSDSVNRDRQQSHSELSAIIKKIVDKKKENNDLPSSRSDSSSSPSLILYSNFIGNNSPDSSFNNSLLAPYSFDLDEELEFSVPINNSSQFAKIPLDKILFTLSCIYLIGVGGWLLYKTQGKFAWLFARSHLTQQVSPEELQFLDYMKRSLEVIERKTQANQATETDSNSIARSHSSTLVYVPVYTPSPYPAIPSQPALLPPVAQIEPPPPPQPVLPSPPPPTPQTSSTPTASPKETSIAAASTNAPLNDYVLVGILELGERSAALFKVNGATRRIWLGEKIDDTGWTLKSVSNQQATISFEGKNRSLSIGENF
jgi:hypothetical protein